MTQEDQLREQNSAIQAIAAGLCALVDELHEAELIDREAVASRLARLRMIDGSEIPTVAALAASIAKGNFASSDEPGLALVVDNERDKA